MEKKGLSLCAKSWIAFALFAVVFGGLAAIASIFDLSISQILTKHSLNPAALGANGDYISHSGFALFFEALGASPLYLMGSVVGLIWFWAAWRKGGKWRIAACFAALLPVIGLTLIVKDVFGYVGEYLGAQLGDDAHYVMFIHEAAGGGYILGISFVFGLLGAAGGLLAWQKIKPEVNDKMVWWTFAIILAAAFYLIVHFVKSPVGRVRFRTMNYLNDFSYYTPWYVANGKRVLTPEGIVAATKEAKEAAIIASDTCKSFPSGHTFSAAMVYSLLALPYLDDKLNRKGVKLALWIATIGYTAVVAISRIVAGAHYMSDVLFGGTIAFLGCMLGREIFVCKGCHVKAMFGIKAKAPVVEAQPEQSNEENLCPPEQSEPQADEAEPKEEEEQA